MRPGDRLVHAFALSMFLAGVPALQFYADDGVMCIPVGAEAGVARILTTTRFFRGNVISCTPSLAEHMIERAPEVLGAPISSLGIRILLCGTCVDHYGLHDRVGAGQISNAYTIAETMLAASRLVTL